eukprot:452104-Rhodomonas_salina.2
MARLQRRLRRPGTSLYTPPIPAYIPPMRSPVLAQRVGRLFTSLCACYGIPGISKAHVLGTSMCAYYATYYAGQKVYCKSIGLRCQPMGVFCDVRY